MENHTFEVFEKKIDQILNLVSTLKQENSDLKTTIQELQKKLTDSQNELQQLKQEAAKSIGMQTEIADYKNKQNRIQSKVENLLEKLQEFEKFE